MESFGIAAKKNRLDRQFHRSSPRLITVEARLDGRRERERKWRTIFAGSIGRKAGYAFKCERRIPRPSTRRESREALYIYIALSLSFSLCLSVEAADSHGVTLI